MGISYSDLSVLALVREVITTQKVGRSYQWWILAGGALGACPLLQPQRRTFAKILCKIHLLAGQINICLESLESEWFLFPSILYYIHMLKSNPSPKGQPPPPLLSKKSLIHHWLQYSLEIL